MEEAKKETGKKKKESGNKALLECQKQNAELNEKILRLNAEMANIKRHAMEDRERFMKYEGEEILTKLLPMVDNFERAIALEQSENEELNKFLEGFKMIYANLLTTLKSVGVEEIEALGKPFDPNKMEAVLTESIVEEETNVVLDVLQKGYIYKDKVLRPAMVKVNE